MLKQQMAKLDTIETELQKTPDKQISLTDPGSLVQIGNVDGYSTRYIN